MNSESELTFDKGRRDLLKLLTLGGVGLLVNGCSRPNTPNTRSPSPQDTVAPVPTMYDGQPLTKEQIAKNQAQAQTQNSGTYVSPSGFTVDYPNSWQKFNYGKAPNINEGAQLIDKGGKINIIAIWRVPSEKNFTQMLPVQREEFKESAVVYAARNYKETLRSKIKEEITKVDGNEAVIHSVMVEKPWLDLTSAITEPFYSSTTAFIQNRNFWLIIVNNTGDADLAKKVNNSFHLVK